MSKDIRSYFQLKKPPKPVLPDDDDDIIPESPDVQIKNKKKESRKKRCLSDSDDEIFTTKKKKPAHEETKPSQKKKTPDKPVLKEVKVVDMFGSGPIKRTEPLVKKVKKNTETGIHSDEEFEKSLLEVDALEESLTKNIKEQSPKQHKEATHNKRDIKSPNKNLRESTNGKEKGKSHVSKDKSPKKLNGDSHSQETKDKHHKPEHHSEAKKDYNKTDSSSYSKKHRSEAITSAFQKNNKKEKHDKEKKEANEREKSKKSTSHEDAGTSKDKKRDFSEFVDSDISIIEEHDDDKHKTKKKKLDKSLNEGKDENERDKSKKSTSHLKTDEEAGTSKDKKRDFSEFVDSDISIIEEHHDDKHKTKKKKLDKSLNESVLTDEERHERKMQCAALYKSYLNRSGPKHLGAKQIPEGSPTCLANCAFLLTGVLDSFERDEVAEAINKFGGCVKNGISKKVTHVLAGDDAGPAKMAKAKDLGIKILSEDEFIQMIIDNSNKTSSTKLDIKKESKDKSPSRKTPKKNLNDKTEQKDSKEKIDKKTPKEKSESHKERKPIKEHLDIKECKNHDKSSKIKEDKSKSPSEVEHHEKKLEINDEIKLETKSKSSSSLKQEGSIKQPTKTLVESVTNAIMWVEKYKPQNIKQIIGQHGDASNVKKLMHWLTKWYVNRKAKLPKPSPWAKNDDGGYFKAALLSGPPGVGKTTTVALVCKELGFDMVEFNASDTRNKTLIKEQIGELLTTTSLSAYAKGDTGNQAVTKKHVLVMDEVDGMAGNEDRGGLQELIALIKSSSVPIICMCNDRNSQKMRTLVNYCYDLRFNRPRVEQIKSAMMSICCKEGIKIAPDALTQLIVAANQDVRQTLNLLSMWAVDPSLMDSDRLKKDAQSGKKDIKLGPWEAVRKVFSAEDHKTMSIHDKSDLFFYDYSLAPLFVHENYLHVSPHCPKNEVLDRFSRAADSISMGDIIDARIRGAQAWSLLPMQAMYASVIPGHELSGHMSGQINFPAWLGNNSKANKMHRLCQEIHAHTRLSTSGSKSSIFLDYAPHLRDAVVTPLLKEKSEGIEKSLQVLESYHLLREDLDSLVELSLWSGQRNPMILIDSKIKAAMTRTYNKKATALPYAPGAVKKGRAKDIEGEDEENDAADEEQDSDPENDAMIKKKKVKEEKASSSKDKAGSSKERPGSGKEKPSTSRKKK